MLFCMKSRVGIGPDGELSLPKVGQPGSCQIEWWIKSSAVSKDLGSLPVLLSIIIYSSRLLYLSTPFAKIASFVSSFLFHIVNSEFRPTIRFLVGQSSNVTNQRAKLFDVNRNRLLYSIFV